MNSLHFATFSMDDDFKSLAIDDFDSKLKPFITGPSRLHASSYFRQSPARLLTENRDFLRRSWCLCPFVLRRLLRKQGQPHQAERGCIELGSLQVELSQGGCSRLFR